MIEALKLFGTLALILVGAFIIIMLVGSVFFAIAKALTNDKEKAEKIVFMTGGVIFFLIFIVFPMSSGIWYDSKNPEPTQQLQQREYRDYFYGYECTDDCSGHEAGYDWAADRGISDLDDCGGNSNSFIEGCQAYVDNNW
jgi:hypothetical protein